MSRNRIGVKYVVSDGTVPKVQNLLANIYRVIRERSTWMKKVEEVEASLALNGLCSQKVLQRKVS